MSELLIVLIDAWFLSLLNYIVFHKTIMRQQMLWPHKWFIYVLCVLCRTELDTANAVDNNCMNWRQRSGSRWGLFSVSPVHWHSHMKWQKGPLHVPHHKYTLIEEDEDEKTTSYPIRPLYMLSGRRLWPLLSEVKSDLCIELWTLYLIHVLQSVQKNIFIHSMHNNDLQNMQRSFS